MWKTLCGPRRKRKLKVRNTFWRFSFPFAAKKRFFWATERGVKDRTRERDGKKVSRRRCVTFSMTCHKAKKDEHDSVKRDWQRRKEREKTWIWYFSLGHHLSIPGKGIHCQKLRKRTSAKSEGKWLTKNWRVRKYRPFFSQIETFTRFYLRKLDLNLQKVCQYWLKW